MTFQEFTKKFNSPYIAHSDDLGEYRATILFIELVGDVVLAERDVDNSLEVIVDSNVGGPSVVSKLKEVMRISSQSVMWASDDGSKEAE